MKKFYYSEFNATLPAKGSEPFGITAVFQFEASEAEGENVAKYLDEDLLKYAAADLVCWMFAVPDSLSPYLRLQFGNPAAYERSAPFGLEGAQRKDNLYQANVTGWFLGKQDKPHRLAGLQ